VTGRIFLKLLLGVFGLLLVALLVIDYFATQVATDAYIANLRQQLADKGHMLALSIRNPDGFRQEDARAVAGAAGGRLTVVRSDGVVIADSEANPAQMENHRTRP
jgi:two-component system phosphate regulon sensor histidine kinase PhoR